MLHKRFNVAVKTINRSQREVRAIVSAETEDADGEIVLQRGIDWSRWDKNPQMFSEHDRHEPIGTGLPATRSIQTVDGNLATGITLRFFAEGLSQAADSQYARLMNGASMGVSIGFIGGEQVGKTWETLQVMEVSLVTLPSNPSCTVIEKTLKGDYMNPTDNPLGFVQCPGPYGEGTEKCPHKVYDRLCPAAKEGCPMVGALAIGATGGNPVVTDSRDPGAKPDRDGPWSNPERSLDDFAVKGGIDDPFHGTYDTPTKLLAEAHRHLASAHRDMKASHELVKESDALHADARVKHAKAIRCLKSVIESPRGSGDMQDEDEMNGDDTEREDGKGLSVTDTKVLVEIKDDEGDIEMSDVMAALPGAVADSITSTIVNETDKAIARARGRIVD